MPVRRISRRVNAPEQDELAGQWRTVATPIASGENTWAAAPGPKAQLVLGAISVQRTSANSTNTTFILKEGPGGRQFFKFETNNNEGALLVIFPPGARPVLPLDTALIADASAANAHIVNLFVVEDEAQWQK